MSDVDWDGVLDSYRPLLSRIRSSREFADLMWEVVAELGTSHAYVTGSGEFRAHGVARRGRRRCSARTSSHAPTTGGGSSTGCCPASRLTRWPGRRWPRPGSAVQAGDEIAEVDGRPVDPVHGPWPLLAATAGKPVELTIRPPTRR